MQNGDNDTKNKKNKKLKPKIKTEKKKKLVVDVTTRLHHGCRLISDWLYIPIRFQHSEEDHTHNAQQEREGEAQVVRVAHFIIDRHTV